MKSHHIHVDAYGDMSFVCEIGRRRRICIDKDGSMAIDMLFLTRPMARELAKVLNHYARTGELPEIEKEEQPK